MIGLLPAAGRADRMHGIPKFLLPVGDTYLLKWHQEQMASAGVSSIYIGRSHANERMVTDHMLDKSRGYTIDSKTMTETVLDAMIWNRDSTVLLGMPDTYFCEGAYQQVAGALSDACEVAVGLFHVRDSQRGKVGQVAVNGSFVADVIDKDATCDYPFVWGLMAFKPSFWHYLQDDMPHVGYGLMPAIRDGMPIRAVFLDGDYWDCGTPDEYFELIVKENVTITFRQETAREREARMDMYPLKRGVRHGS